jgi:hypothetical protein
MSKLDADRLEQGSLWFHIKRQLAASRIRATETQGRQYLLQVVEGLVSLRLGPPALPVHVLQSGILGI